MIHRSTSERVIFSKSSVIYVRPLQEDIVLNINGPVIDEMTKTGRFPMV